MDIKIKYKDIFRKDMNFLFVVTKNSNIILPVIDF